MITIAIQPAAATPIQPTAEQLLRQAERPVVPFVPAQVGWKDSAADPQRADLEGFSFAGVLRDAEAARARRALLLEIARPDPRVLLAFGAIIFLIRKMRTLHASAGVPAPHPAKA